MKRKRLMVLILIISIFLMVGCEKETSSIETESKFNIFFSEEEIRKYIKISNEFSDELEKNLENPKLFLEIEEEVISLAEEVLEKCDSVLFSKGETVYIRTVNPDDMRLRSGGGEEGSFAYRGGAVLYINPMTDNWKDLFSRYLAHEYHHSVCMERNAASWDMLGWLILEGRAEMFAEMLYPDAKVELGRTGTVPLPIITEKEMWDKIKENLNSFDNNYRKGIMFGNIKRIPSNCGYRIGYTIMQEFVKNNPDVSVEEWTNMRAEDSFEKSGYEERLERRLEEYNN